MTQRNPQNNPLGAIGGLIIMALVFVGLFMLARFIFRILAFLSPALFIAALILDHRVVLDYGKWLIGMVRRNPLMGIAAIVLSVVGFPLLSAFLAGKALLMRNVRKARQEQERQLRGEYIDFEELEEEEPLKLPELSKVRREEPPPREEPRPRQEEPPKSQKKPDADSPYDNLFD